MSTMQYYKLEGTHEGSGLTYLTQALIATLVSIDLLYPFSNLTSK